MRPEIQKFVQDIKSLHRKWRLKSGELRTNDDFELCPIAALWCHQTHEPNPGSRLNWRFSKLGEALGLGEVDRTLIVFASDGDPPRTPAASEIIELRAEFLKELQPRVLS